MLRPHKPRRQADKRQAPRTQAGSSTWLVRLARTHTTHSQSNKRQTVGRECGRPASQGGPRRAKARARRSAACAVAIAMIRHAPCAMLYFFLKY
eukprot:scaffold34504_cov174-Isochrysis_galbana.AAC.1